MKFNKKILLLNKSLVSVNVWSVCIFCYIYLTSFSCRKKLQRLWQTKDCTENSVAHIIKVLRVSLQYQKISYEAHYQAFFWLRWGSKLSGRFDNFAKSSHNNLSLSTYIELVKTIIICRIERVSEKNEWNFDFPQSFVRNTQPLLRPSSLCLCANDEQFWQNRKWVESCSCLSCFSAKRSREGKQPQK